MENRLGRIRMVVKELTKEEVAKQIRGLEESLIAENAVVGYSLNNGIDLGSYIYRTNAFSDIAESFRIAAYEQGKLEDRLYA